MAPRRGGGAGGGYGGATVDSGAGAGGGSEVGGGKTAAHHQLPAGLLLTDVQQRSWRLGPPLGRGGFGQIYAADPDDGRPVGADAAHVAKVEPHSSGPLFSEMHCYHRVGGADAIDSWVRARRLRRLGMPRFVGSGSVLHAGDRYRFMVIERFGSDLQKLLNANGGRFPTATVLLIGLQVLDTLEYIHSREYIHADIKAQNLLLGYTKNTENQVYLVDFGLACRYSTNGRHKPYRADLRKAHDGTIEFTSRDAHIGAHSRRGDLEILGYNLLQWAAGRLPWRHCLHDADAVARLKNAFMWDVPALVRACFPDRMPTGVDAVQQYLQSVAELEFDTRPDYQCLRRLLRAGLRALGSPPARLRFCGAQVTQPDYRSCRRQSSPAKRARISPAVHSTDSGSGQENSLGCAHLPPGQRGRAPLRLVTENGPPPSDVGWLPDDGPPPPPLVTSPSLRSDGQLRDFDWQHYNQMMDQAVRRKAASARSAASDSGGDECAEPGFTTYDNITPAMRAVILKRLTRSPEKVDGRGKKRSRSSSRGRTGGVSPPAVQVESAVPAPGDRRTSARLSARAGRSRPPDPPCTPPCDTAAQVSQPRQPALPARRLRSGHLYSV